MEIILLKRIAGLGNVGDLVKVKAGYARNFLIPRSLCLKATKENRKIFEEKKLALEAENLKLKDEAVAVHEKLHGTKLSLIRNSSEAGSLFGSVKAKDLEEALLLSGFKVSKEQVKLKENIKNIGVHKVNVELHGDVISEVVVFVGRNDESVQSLIKEYEDSLAPKKSKEAKVNNSENKDKAAEKEVTEASNSKEEVENTESENK